jgi:hypothetical protein
MWQTEGSENLLMNYKARQSGDRIINYRIKSMIDKENETILR